jgi:hypothetical protein
MPFEGSSAWLRLRPFRRQRRALIGIAIAFLDIFAADRLNLPELDGAASIGRLLLSRARNNAVPARTMPHRRAGVAPARDIADPDRRRRSTMLTA